MEWNGMEWKYNLSIIIIVIARQKIITFIEGITHTEWSNFAKFYATLI